MQQDPIKQRDYSVLVTRPKPQAENLCCLIEQRGWRAVRFPTLQIVAVDNSAIKRQLGSLHQYHWLIFISRNAVNFALLANAGEVGAFKQCAIAAIGKATAKALTSAGLSVKLIPTTQFSTEGLLATPAMNAISGNSCLIIRGQGGEETLASSLRMRGARVDYMEVYARKQPKDSNPTALRLLRQNQLDAITISSGDALNNMLAMLDGQLQRNLLLVPLVVISNRLKNMAKKSGFKYIVVAENPDDLAITEAILSLNPATN